MHLAGKDEFLEFHSLCSEGFHQPLRLTEGNVAIVIAVNQKDGRAPVLNVGQRGRIERRTLDFTQLIGIQRGERAVAPEAPVVDSVHVDARGKQVAGPRERHGCQVAAIRTAPHADSLGIDVGSRSHI